MGGPDHARQGELGIESTGALASQSSPRKQIRQVPPIGKPAGPEGPGGACPGADPLVGAGGGHSRPSASPSANFQYRAALNPSQCCVAPEGHATVSRPTRPAPPRPNSNRRSAE